MNIELVTQASLNPSEDDSIETPRLQHAVEPVSTAPVKTFLQVADQYYVLATSILADRENRVLKQGETFAIFDSYGDVQPVTHSESGIFHRGTRHLSQFELMIFEDGRPLLLNSTLRDDSGVLKVDMTNRDLNLPNQGFLGKGTLHFHRETFLLDAKCFEQVTITNFSDRAIEIPCAYRVRSDFADIFEVRGAKREKRGEILQTLRNGSELVLSYQGLDDVRRSTRIHFSVPDFVFSDLSLVRFQLHVPARGKSSFHITLAFHDSNEKADQIDFKEGFANVLRDHEKGREAYCRISSSNEQFDRWLRRSTDDLVMMTTLTEQGSIYPYAGIPWFCAPFGRDGIITAMECLWANPAIAKGVLTYLTATQAQSTEPARDSTPGKIIHEVRDGEMAALNEIPFGRYYGSVDSTPLFVALAGQYLTRTNDLETIKKIWPAIRAALHWLDAFGDLDGDGFVEYQRENENGLVQQGWKDSHDSVFHADGSDARGPIALCEVQGYVYVAKIEGAKIARSLSEANRPVSSESRDASENDLEALAVRLEHEAIVLKEKFDRSFWLEDLGTYALALDFEKKPCRVASSNAGQCLFTGIVKTERAEKLIRTLMRSESFCGWGVRTIASDTVRYNPMSYHNGSVWPHDVALIAWGMARYGFKAEVERLFNGLFRAVQYMELMRMPEVYCGFPRREGEAPTLYPNACSPQAWAAASVYLVLQSILGISIDAVTKRVLFSLPRLPDSIERLKISMLKVDNSEIDLMIQNYHSDVSVQISRRSADLSVGVEK